MSDAMKVAVILGAAIVVVVSILTYFSPFHSCMRAYDGRQVAVAAQRCIGGR